MRSSSDRQLALNNRADLLIEGFPTCVRVFGERPPFRRPGQFELHRATIAAGRKAGSVRAAIASPEFIGLLYKTLRAWGIGKRGSRLVSADRFASGLNRQAKEIASLESLAIDDRTLNVSRASDRLWKVLDELVVTDNKARLVPATKTLHHLLPDLVVPIDREYTQTFFGWHNTDFQNHQATCFRQAFQTFQRIAVETSPSRFVGSGWNTSKTKVIDNAIVGFSVITASTSPLSKLR